MGKIMRRPVLFVQIWRDGNAGRLPLKQKTSSTPPPCTANSSPQQQGLVENLLNPC